MEHFFEASFEALTDHKRLRWQLRMFERLAAGIATNVCDLPTGLGKTSVIPIWLIALAAQVRAGKVTLPRRLIYIVNRRTVVDQATHVAEQLRLRLLCPQRAEWSCHSIVLNMLAEALCKLRSSDDSLLAVSTLRGELADNEEWKADPARAAIIIGTIDMIGSKLLFSGYGDGPYWRPQHAGLIGQDSLMVHDEAHLTPAFSESLRHIADAQQVCGEPRSPQMFEPRSLQILELSATMRGEDSQKRLGMEQEDQEDDVVRQRLGAEKHLHRYEADSRELVMKLVELAMAHETAPAKVLIYVRSPDHAQQIANALRKKTTSSVKRVALLTGTIRGYERDQFAKSDPAYTAFLQPESVPTASMYLVSTSAGEVGIDLDADHMVCDLTTLDAMIQRLGRVNRRGGQGRMARIDVVELKPVKQDSQHEFEESITATAEILKSWQEASPSGAIDVSPGHLRTLMEDTDPELLQRAFAPKPAIPPLSDILLDAWSMTSIKGKFPGRPEVAEYLHGLANEPPETYVAWREEITLLKDAESDVQNIEEWFQACPVLSHERLRDRTDRVKDTLARLLRRHRKYDVGNDFPVVILDERGEAEWRTLAEIIEKEPKIEYRTIVLPIEAGGLNTDGALDGEAENHSRDVAEESLSIRRQRWISINGEAGKRYRRLMTGEVADRPPGEFRERERIVLKEVPEREGERGSQDLVLMVGPNELAVGNPETAKFRQALSIHSSFIAAQIKRIATALGLDGPLKEVLIIAARWHDRGKDREVWQRFACNPNASEPLAKSGRYLHGRALGGYRHEFGSLLDAVADAEIMAHPELDLILHLIAAHHGWARPHFDLKAHDPEHTSKENEDAAAEVMRRFGHLQQRFGRWGLAWLESLLRCADIAASKQREQGSEPQSAVS